MTNETYFNRYKNSLIEINEGEEVCKKCKGKGQVKLKTPNYIRNLCCDKCLGEGKLDWIEKATGKKVNGVRGNTINLCMIDDEWKENKNE